MLREREKEKPDKKGIEGEMTSYKVYNMTTWEQFNSDVNGILEAELRGNVDQKMGTITTICSG